MSAAQRDDRPQESEALRTALDLLARGLWPVAIHGLKDRVASPGKQPIGDEWGRVRPSPALLRGIYAANPGAGVGIKLDGVVDIENDTGAEGEATLLEMMGGEELETMGWASDRGPHRLVRFDPRFARYGKSIIKIGGLEIRIGTVDLASPKQLQSVCPPSPRADGTPRAWNGVEEIAGLPDCFFAYLERAFAARDETLSTPRQTIPIYTPKPGEWTAEDRARSYLATVEPAVSGQGGHNKAIYAACKVGPGFDLPPAVARRLLADWGRSCQPPWSDRELDHKVTESYKIEPRRGWLLGDSNGATPATKATYATKAPPYVANVAYVAPGDACEDVPVVARKWPAPLGEAAWRGPAGAFALATREYTEADPVGVLVQTLVGWGNLVGRHAYFEVNATRHHVNLFVCTAGPTAAGRKGTSWDVARMALTHCDPNHTLKAITGGLSSGEGLIWAIRDPITKTEPIKEHGRIVDYQEVIADPGVEDKRLLVVETELGGTLKVLTREGNTLSALVRQAWDSGMLRTMTKNNAAAATDAHISIIGHITEQEVNKYLSANDAANGFANRFLWVAVKQTRFLPRGATIAPEAVAPHLEQLRAAMSAATVQPLCLERDAEANKLWDSVYVALCKGRPGLLGAILGRAVPQIMRVACIYALMDRSPRIRRSHLESSLELWRYCEDSAAFIFGDAMGDPDADRLLSALRAAPEGLTQTEIVHGVFQKHKTREQVAACLGRLLEVGRVASIVDDKTGGRPATRWIVARPPAT